MIEAMCDLETWGIRTTSVVRSVGIVVFDGRDVLERHYFRVAELGPDGQRIPRTTTIGGEMTTFSPRTMDQSTIDWWAKPENATAQLTITEAPLVTWEEGRTICGRVGDKVGKIWSKPGMFDLPMLRDLFGQDIWAYWKENCLSTLLAEFDPARTTRPKFDGVQHNALDDAMHAHVWLCDLRKRFIDRKTTHKALNDLRSTWNEQDLGVPQTFDERIAWAQRMASQFNLMYAAVGGNDTDPEFTP